MNKRFIACALLIAFIGLAGPVLSMPVGDHEGHDAGCPFAQNTTMLCATPLAHLEHWRSAFTATLAEILVLTTVLVLLIAGAPFLTPKADPQYERYRLRARAPRRPSLLQELFSRGILNPKAP